MRSRMRPRRKGDARTAGVTRVVSRIGRPEMATDTIGPDESDVYVFLKPKSSGA